MPTTERIPIFLMEPFLEKVIHQYGQFLHQLLVKYLQDDQTNLCGRIKNNRTKFPKEIINVALPKGFTGVVMKIEC